MEKTAVIVGSNGQDGILLSQHLQSLGYAILPITRDTIDITDPIEVKALIKSKCPDEVYFLAAYHHSSEDIIESEDELYKKSFIINSFSVVYFLESIKKYTPHCKFFYASSSLIFRSSKNRLLNEDSLIEPMCSYSLSKVSGMQACDYYRKKYGIFTSTGILFNHESEFRKKNFLTKKISTTIAQIKKNGNGELSIGDIDSIVDWGYAPDYVVAMQKVLQLDQPEDFIIASGVEHTVREFLIIAFEHVGLDYTDYVKVNSKIISRVSMKRIGDPSKLKTKTGWRPSISFKEMVCKLIDYEINRL